MDQKQKDFIYDLILENKMKIFNRKEKEEPFKKFLIKNNIFFDFEITIRNVIVFLKNINEECKIPECKGIRKFKGFRTSRTEHGFNLYCSKECEFKARSIRQKGTNNTCHRMSPDSFESMCRKNSEIMKSKIKNGDFTPCITNSWSGSKIELEMAGRIHKYRSTWEAFFHICNQHLEYEKIRIPYLYKEKNHNYIVDFVDFEKKIIFEIKPERCLMNNRVIAKNIYAKEWCSKNGFELVTITDEWFKMNFNKYKNLLKNQPNEEIILLKLKQFNEDKKYKRNRL